MLSGDNLSIQLFVAGLAFNFGMLAMHAGRLDSSGFCNRYVCNGGAAFWSCDILATNWTKDVASGCDFEAAIR